jgi:hypothetical protein
MSLEHFDPSEEEPPFQKITCTKGCHTKAYCHPANMSVDPEELNIQWNRDGRGGGNDPNNSENILIAWLQTLGNYKKFRSPLPGRRRSLYAKM